jgi:serine/threonine-protein kinase
VDRTRPTPATSTAAAANTAAACSATNTTAASSSVRLGADATGAAPAVWQPASASGAGERRGTARATVRTGFAATHPGGASHGAPVPEPAIRDADEDLAAPHGRARGERDQEKTEPGVMRRRRCHGTRTIPSAPVRVREVRHALDSRLAEANSLDEQVPTPGVKIGDVLDGKYRIDGVLGAGGTGVVLAAHHLPLAERVAIKFLQAEALPNPDAVMRFAREARAAVRIKSEHVARVLDVGTFENGTNYIVMEHLEGSDMRSWLEEQGAMPVQQAVTFVLQACEAIAEAHALGIIHRDLKPANLFIIRRPDGELSIKVLDFGISKLIGMGTVGATSDLSMTTTRAVIGSPLYMSPEQMKSARNVDARSDIWSLGVVLYEAIAGAPPFDGETIAEICVSVATGATPALPEARGDLPPGFEAVVARCLEKDPAQRYQTVAELALALGPYAPERAQESVRRVCGTLQSAGLSDAGAASALTPAPAQGPKRGWNGARMAWRRRRWSLGVVGAAVLAVLATGLWWRLGAGPPKIAVVMPAVPARAEPRPAPPLPAAAPLAPVAPAAPTPADVLSPLSHPKRLASKAKPSTPPRSAFDDRK